MADVNRIKRSLSNMIERANDALNSKEVTVHDAVMELVDFRNKSDGLVPMLAAGSTWYKGTTKKTTITSITIVDSYEPTGSETESWNADVNDEGAIKCYITGTDLTIAGNGMGRIYANPDSSFMFSGADANTRFTALTKITGADLLDTRYATTFEKMFSQCRKLESVDVSTWDTSNVTTMFGTFQLCTKLKRLDLSRWDVSKVTSFYAFFQSVIAMGVNEIVSLGDLSGWDVRSCTDFRSMFQCCGYIRDLNLSSWRNTPTANTTSMFSSMYRLERVSFGDGWHFNGNWLDHTKTEYINGVNASWYNESEVEFAPTIVNDQPKYVVLPDNTAATYTAHKPSNIPMLAPGDTWYDRNVISIKQKPTITKIRLVDSYEPTGIENYSWDASDKSCPGTVTAYVTGTVLTLAGNGTGRIVANKNSSFLFSSDEGYEDSALEEHKKVRFSNVTSFEGLDLLDTYYAEDMTGIFMLCTKVTSLDLSAWDVSNVKKLDYAFRRCSALTTLNTTGWDTHNLERAEFTFAFCPAMTSLDLNHWDVANLKSIKYMFHMCPLLVDLHIDEWNTKSLETIEGLFYYNKAQISSAWYMRMTSFNVPNWDVRRLRNMSYAFGNCIKLTDVCIGNGETLRLEKLVEMFGGCTALKSVDLSGWYTDNVVSTADMFKDCTALTSVNLGGWSLRNVKDMSYMFNHCTDLTSIDLSDVIADKVEYTTNMFYGCDNLASINVSSMVTKNAVGMSWMFGATGGYDAVTYSNEGYSDYTNGILLDDDGAFACSHGGWNDDFFPTIAVTGGSFVFNGRCYTVESNVLNPNIAESTYLVFARLIVYSDGSFTLAGYKYETANNDYVLTPVRNDTQYEFILCSARYNNDIGEYEIIKDLRGDEYYCPIAEKNTSVEMDYSNYANGIIWSEGSTELDVTFDTATQKVSANNGVMLINEQPISIPALVAVKVPGKHNLVRIRYSYLDGTASMDVLEYDPNVDKTNLWGEMLAYPWFTPDGVGLPIRDDAYYDMILAAIDYEEDESKWVVTKYRGGEHCPIAISYGDPIPVSRLSEITIGNGFTFYGSSNDRLVSFPTPSAGYIDGADGYWYNSDGIAYAPNEIPSNIAATYSAIPVAPTPMLLMLGDEDYVFTDENGELPIA